MPTQQAQSQADLGIALRIVIERSVNRLDALERSLHISEAPTNQLIWPIPKSLEKSAIKASAFIDGNNAVQGLLSRSPDAVAQLGEAVCG